MYTLALVWHLYCCCTGWRRKTPRETQCYRTEMSVSLNHTLTASECRLSGWGGGIWDGKTLTKFYIICRFCSSTKAPVYQIFSLYINFSSLYRVYYSKMIVIIGKRGILFLIEAGLINVANCQIEVCISVIRNVHPSVRGQFGKADVRFSEKDCI